MLQDEQQQTTEVRETTVRDGATSVQRQTVATSATTSSTVVMSRVVLYIAGFIIVLLALRVLFFLLGASQSSSFVGFVYALSGVFSAPFTGIFPTPADGSHALDSASLVAMVVYALIAWGVAKLFTISKPVSS